MAIGLVLGGGAPNLTLMTGALLALDEAGVDFKVMTTTGAGMVVGLLYAAPRKAEPSETWIDARRRALRTTREMGIDDAIYRTLPVNYKIFHKPGPLAEQFSRATIPIIEAIPRKTRRQRLLGDTLALWATAMSPSNLRSSSKGLCQPAPWIDHFVDFRGLRRNLETGDKKFRLSAYCIEDGKEETFNKHEITADHFKAALAMPFIYAPYKLKAHDGRMKTYLEGSAFKTLELNPQHVMCENDIDTIIFFDLMGNRHLIGEPRWLIDAWGKSIVAPLTRLAEQDLEMFKLRRDLHMKQHEIDALKEQVAAAKRGEAPPNGKVSGNGPEASAGAHDHGHHHGNGEKPDPHRWNPDDEHAHSHAFFDRTEVLRMNFRDFIPPEQWPYVLDWSHSNMSRLFDVGVETGKAFVETHRDRLDLSVRLDPARPVRVGLDPDHAAERDACH